jgi:hypothetical protein
MKTKKTRKKQTQASLAALLGVSRQLIAAHRKHADAPAIDDIPGWSLFLAQKGRIGSAPDDLRRAIAQERLDILKETRIRLARENEIEAGKTILAAEARSQAAQAAGYFMNEIERWGREMPPSLAGLSAVEISKLMNARQEQIRKSLKEKLERIGQ